MTPGLSSYFKRIFLIDIKKNLTYIFFFLIPKHCIGFFDASEIYFELGTDYGSNSFFSVDYSIVTYPIAIY